MTADSMLLKPGPAALAVRHALVPLILAGLLTGGGSAKAVETLIDFGGLPEFATSSYSEDGFVVSHTSMNIGRTAGSDSAVGLLAAGPFGAPDYFRIVSEDGTPFDVLHIDIADPFMVGVGGITAILEDGSIRNIGLDPTDDYQIVGRSSGFNGFLEFESVVELRIEADWALDNIHLERILDEFETRADTALSGPIVGTYSGVPTLMECARNCREDGRCASFAFDLGAETCQISRQNAFAGGTSPGLTSGISRAVRAYTTTLVASLPGAPLATIDFVDTASDCAQLCTEYPGAGGFCRSFVYRPDGRRCELNEADDFAPLQSFNALVALRRELTHRVQGIYVNAGGEPPKVGAVEFGNAMMNILQQHWSMMLGGNTFRRESDDIATFSTLESHDSVLDRALNHEFLKENFFLEDQVKKNVTVVFIDGPPGTQPGPAFGGGNVATWPDNWLEPSYQAWQTGGVPALRDSLAGLSHELGHAFGLLHTKNNVDALTLQSCVLDSGGPEFPIPLNLLMQQGAILPLYDFVLDPIEKDMIRSRDSTYGRLCLGALFGRPHPSHHLDPTFVPEPAGSALAAAAVVSLAMLRAERRRGQRATPTAK